MPLTVPAPNASPSVLPSRLRMTMRYADSYSMSTGVGGVVGTTQVNRLNSLYDPDKSNVGHQPYGFDQLLGVLYAAYWVRSCRLRILAVTPGSTADVGFAFQIGVDGQIPTINGFGQTYLPERGNLVTFPLAPSGNSRTREVSVDCDLAAIFGVPQLQYRDAQTQYTAQYTANPSSVAIVEIGTFSYSGAAAEAATLQLQMEFDVELFQPIAPTHS